MQDILIIWIYHDIDRISLITCTASKLQRQCEKSQNATNRKRAASGTSILSFASKEVKYGKCLVASTSWSSSFLQESTVRQYFEWGTGTQSLLAGKRRDTKSVLFWEKRAECLPVHSVKYSDCAFFVHRHHCLFAPRMRESNHTGTGTKRDLNDQAHGHGERSASRKEDTDKDHHSGTEAYRDTKDHHSGTEAYRETNIEVQEQRHTEIPTSRYRNRERDHQPGIETKTQMTIQAQTPKEIIAQAQRHS